MLLFKENKLELSGSLQFTVDDLTVLPNDRVSPSRWRRKPLPWS